MSSFRGLFGAQAGDYRAFRPVWPAEVFTRILARAPRPRRRAIDLGAGTGMVTERLAGFYDEVVAVEPDEKMLAQITEHERLKKVHARAEDVVFDSASVDLVTAGNSFHWMEGAELCERVRAWLRPHGVFAVFRYNPPHAAAGALEGFLQHEYSVVWREHVHARLFDPDYTRRTLARSSLGRGLDVSWIENELTFSLDELVGFCRSTSYGGGHARSQPDAEAYWREFETRIRAAAGPGPFVLDFGVELLLAQKSDP